MTIDQLRRKKIVVLGLGVNNRHLVEYFKRMKIRHEVIEKWETPNDLIGKVDNFDIIFRTPGLQFLSKPIQQALKKGVEIYSQTKLFFDLCPGKIIGVTGTKGKGTTATLVGRILEASGSKVWVGGNVGSDPFEFFEEIKADDWVVLELSSFQLQDLHKSPHISVVLQIVPEHMDYHHDFSEYVAAKKNVVSHAKAGDYAVLNYDNETSRTFADFTNAQVFWNSTRKHVKPGCYIEEDKIIWETENVRAEIIDTSKIKLMGKFNLENVTAAIAASAVAVGATDVNIFQKAIEGFEGLPHRLEFVAEILGVKFFNDSFSTTPEAAIAAIESFDSPLILIIGGSEKKSDYEPLAKTIASSKIKALIPIGITGPRIAKGARQAGFAGRIIDKQFEDMQAVVFEANTLAKKGDIVLLSPASASFGMFVDYKQRGELFKKFVKRLE